MRDSRPLVPRWVGIFAALLCFAAVANWPYGFYKLPPRGGLWCLNGAGLPVARTRAAQLGVDLCSGSFDLQPAVSNAV